MIRLAISVEGRTEEEFVNYVLKEHLHSRGVEPQPIPLNGNITVERVAADMERLFWGFDFVTSLVDFYGFRGKTTETREELEQRIFQEVDRRISRSWDQSRAFPYVQQYEFEGLLFSNVSTFANISGVPQRRVEDLEKIRSEFCTPEDINDNPETAPSKRLEKMIPRYRKVVYGPLIAAETGLDVIRSECPRFNAWVGILEQLGNSPAPT